MLESSNQSNGLRHQSSRSSAAPVSPEARPRSAGSSPSSPRPRGQMARLGIELYRLVANRLNQSPKPSRRTQRRRALQSATLQPRLGTNQEPLPRDPAAPPLARSKAAREKPRSPAPTRSVIPLDAARTTPKQPRRDSSPRSRSAPSTVTPLQSKTRSRPPSAPPSDGAPSRPGAVSSSPRSESRKGSVPAKSLPIKAFIQGARLVILGVGVWAIAGTVLSAWNPATRYPTQSELAAAESIQEGATVQELGSGNELQLAANDISTGRVLSELEAKIFPLTQSLTDLTPGLFLIDLDNGNYFNLNGDLNFAAASMIKVPILIAFFQDVDAGKIQLNDLLTMEQGDVAEGSGDMQYDPVGSQYTALEVATNMIIISDNTATNMLIRHLGGITVLNQRFQEWGLKETQLQSLLPDLAGTNTTSPQELANLLVWVSQGKLVSIKSRDRLLDIMQHTVTDSLLPTALGDGATIAHKTGDIGSLIGDTGLIDLPNGKRYAITVMVKRPHNDDRASELVRQISAVVYEYLNQSPHSPREAVTPAVSPAPPETDESTVSPPAVDEP